MRGHVPAPGAPHGLDMVPRSLAVALPADGELSPAPEAVEHAPGHRASSLSLIWWRRCRRKAEGPPRGTARQIGGCAGLRTDRVPRASPWSCRCRNLPHDLQGTTVHRVFLRGFRVEAGRRPTWCTGLAPILVFAATAYVYDCEALPVLLHCKFHLAHLLSDAFL